ncbi:MAG: inositol monophosphatase family protein [Candidatus Eiseniibacteriota bacterium]
MSGRQILDVAEKAAREAGDVLLGFVGKAFEVRHKGDVDLVTQADRASEDRIVRIVRERFPDHAVLAEEGGGTPARRDAEFLWVVDPLDGTTNFAHGLPIWSVSIGVLRHGAPFAGVVLDPSRGECFRAQRGEGAWLDGRRIRVSDSAALDRALLVTGFPYDVRSSPVNNLDHFERFLLRSRAVRRLGSAALDLAYVACGRFDGFWELKLHPWDMAAGALLVEEAGGRVTRFGGEPLDVFGEEIVAAPPGLIQAMLEILVHGKRPTPPGE